MFKLSFRILYNVHNSYFVNFVYFVIFVYFRIFCIFYIGGTKSCQWFGGTGKRPSWYNRFGGGTGSWKEWTNSSKARCSFGALRKAIPPRRRTSGSVVSALINGIFTYMYIRQYHGTCIYNIYKIYRNTIQKLQNLQHTSYGIYKNTFMSFYLLVFFLRKIRFVSKVFWPLWCTLYNQLISWISDSDSVYLTVYGHIL